MTSSQPEQKGERQIVVERWHSDGPMPEAVVVRTFYADGRKPTERSYWPMPRGPRRIGKERSS